MKLNKELLIEFEDCLNALNEMVGIEPSAMSELRDAIMTAKIIGLDKIEKEAEQPEGGGENFLCPKCGSDDIFSIVQHHHKCRKCNIRFATDEEGNKRNYATLDKMMDNESPSDQLSVTEKPKELSDEEIEKQFPTDLKVLCELNDIPLNFNADQGEYLYQTRAHNTGKQEGAKWMRSKYENKD